MTILDLNPSDDMGEEPKLDITVLPERFIEMTGGATTAHAWEALEIIASGELPPHFISERAGPSGTKIKYLKAAVATQILNRAFKYLWNYEVDPQVHIGTDGSVAVIGKLTVHFPLFDPKTEKPLRDKEGRPMYHTRVIQEVGAFEAYPKYVQKVTGTDRTGAAIMETVVATDAHGNVEYTMNEADRIASAASRGLVKCLLRAFSIGINLMEKEEVPMPPETAYRLLLDYARDKWGLTEEEVRALMRENGYTAKSQLVADFGLMWKLIQDRGRERQASL